MAKNLSQSILAINTSTLKSNFFTVGSCRILPCTIGRVETKAYLAFSFEFLKRRLPFNCDGAGGKWCLPLSRRVWVPATEVFTTAGLSMGEVGDWSAKEVEAEWCKSKCCSPLMVAEGGGLPQGGGPLRDGSRDGCAWAIHGGLYSARRRGVSSGGGDIANLHVDRGRQQRWRGGGAFWCWQVAICACIGRRG